MALRKTRIVTGEIRYRCTMCKGKGKIKAENVKGNPRHDMRATCTFCLGTGWVKG